MIFCLRSLRLEIQMNNDVEHLFGEDFDEPETVSAEVELVTRTLGMSSKC